MGEPDVTCELEVISLLCPYTSKRLEDPCIASCCMERHPRKAMSRNVAEELRRKTKWDQAFRCPHCKIDIKMQFFKTSETFEMLLSMTKYTAQDEVYLMKTGIYSSKEGMHFLMEAPEDFRKNSGWIARPHATTRPTQTAYAPPPLPPFRTNAPAARIGLMMQSIQPIEVEDPIEDTDGKGTEESEPSLERAGGTFNSSECLEDSLKTIHSSEKAIAKLLKQHSKVALSGMKKSFKKKATIDHEYKTGIRRKVSTELMNFWATTQSNFEKQFGKLKYPEK